MDYFGPPTQSNRTQAPMHLTWQWVLVYMNTLLKQRFKRYLMQKLWIPQLFRCKITDETLMSQVKLTPMKIKRNSYSFKKLEVLQHYYWPTVICNFDSWKTRWSSSFASIRCWSWIDRLKNWCLWFLHLLQRKEKLTEKCDRQSRNPLKWSFSQSPRFSFWSTAALLVF